MKYTKFFNSNPSVSGNNAMSNIEALAQFDIWLAGQKIVNISVGESQDTYTPLTFTKENGETYTVNIPTVKGDTGATGPQGPKGDTGATGAQGPKGDIGEQGEVGLQCFTIIKIVEEPNIGVVINYTIDNDFNRTPNTGEKFVNYVLYNNELYVCTSVVTKIQDSLATCSVIEVYPVYNSTTPKFKAIYTTYPITALSLKDNVIVDGNIGVHNIKIKGTYNGTNICMYINIFDSKLSAYDINSFYDKYKRVTGSNTMSATGYVNSSDNRKIITMICGFDFSVGNTIGISGYQME